MVEHSLEDFKHQISELYEGKKWNNSNDALMRRWYLEIAELDQAVSKLQAGEPNPTTIRGGKIDCHHKWSFFAQVGELEEFPYGKIGCSVCGATGRPYTIFDIAEEFSDQMHFGLEYMKMNAPNADLDMALQNKIDSNWRNKKKTTDENGKMILR